MKPLTVNLKHLYQCRIMWIYHFMIIMTYFIFIASINMKKSVVEPPAFVFFVFCFLFGWRVGSLVADVWNKPFVLSLPGQIKASKAMLLIVWFIIAVPLFILKIFVFSEDLLSFSALMELIGILSLSFWGGVMVFQRRYIIPCLALIFLLWFHPKPMEEIIMTYPWTVTLICLIICLLIYHTINMERFRYLCGNTTLAFSVSSYSTDKIKRINQTRLSMKQGKMYDRVIESVGKFFLERIKSKNRSPLLAHLWGQAYLAVGPFIAQWKSILPVSLILAFYFWFVGRSGPDQVRFIFEWLFFTLFSLAGAWLYTQPRFKSFILIGRKVYFLSGIIALAVSLTAVIGVMCISIILLNILSGIFSNSVLFGETFTILPSIRCALLVVPILLPFFGGLFIIIKKDAILAIGLIMFIPASLIIPYKAIQVLEGKPFIFALMFVLLLAMLTWSFHLAALYYDSMKRSLC